MLLVSNRFHADPIYASEFSVVAVKFRCVVVLSLLVAVRFSGLVFHINRADLGLNFNEMQP